MANWFEPGPLELREWKKWCDARPPAVKAVAERFPPWGLLRMKSTGHRVWPHSFSNDGTLTVTVSGRFNAVMMERNVFGISPDDLEPCELPGPNDPVGATLTAGSPEELAFVNAERAKRGIPPLAR